MAAHLLPYDPVVKKHFSNNNKRGLALISDIQVSEVDVLAAGAKPSIGKTGVHLCYYKAKEYKKLTDAQCNKLLEWRDLLLDGDPRKPNPTKSKRQKNGKLFEAKIATAVGTHLQKLF